MVNGQKVGTMALLQYKMTRLRPVGVALTLLLGLSACSATPAPETGTSSAQGNCTSLAAPAGTPASIASRCSDRADDSDILGRESGLAYYHAATAYNTLGQYNEAARMAALSFDALDNNDPWLINAPDQLSDREEKVWYLPRRNFRLDRILQYGEAFQGVAESFRADGTAPGVTVCSAPMDCLSKAITRTSAGKSVAGEFSGSASAPREPEYDSYYLLLGELYSARGTAADTEPAIAAYREVAASPLATADRAKARQQLADLTIALGEAASAKEDAASSGLAIRYYNIALEAAPTSPEAHLGLGDVYLGLGLTSGSPDQLRSAEAAYTSAINNAESDAQRAAAYSGRGLARDTLADLLGTTHDGALADYQAASTFANSAEAFLTLAEACSVRGDWVCADNNYTQGIALLRSEGASGSEIAEALIGQADVRRYIGSYSAGDIRNLLQQAVQVAPGSATAIIELARHDMSQGNWASAENGFNKVARASTGGLNGADRYRAEANAALSTLYVVRPSPDLVQAAGYADAAVQLDGTNPVYRRNACLVRIYRGGSSVTHSSNASRCALGNHAESLLLQAMFEMRKAQHVGLNSAQQIRRKARDLIDTALTMVEPGQLTDFDWPEASSLPPVKTKAILLYLKEATLACGGNYTFNLPETDGLTAADYASARAFLDFYRARLCT